MTIYLDYYKAKLVDRFKFYNTYSSNTALKISEFIYYYKNPEKAESERYCKVCGKKNKFVINKYQNYCSRTCMCKDEERRKQAREWLKKAGSANFPFGRLEVYFVDIDVAQEVIDALNKAHLDDNIEYSLYELKNLNEKLKELDKKIYVAKEKLNLLLAKKEELLNILHNK